MTDGTGDAFEETRKLLEAESERRGISGADLLDQLAREGRLTGLVDIGPQDDDLSRWAAIPQWATDAIPQGAITFGTMGSGKTNTADLTRARLEAEGIPFEETVRTNEFGEEFTKFAVERPEGNRE